MMTVEEQRAIRKLKSEMQAAYGMWDRFGGDDREQTYLRLREEYEAYTNEQITEAFTPSVAELQQLYKFYLTHLVMAYRVQRAEQLEPVIEDMWSHLQTLVETTTDDIDIPDDLPMIPESHGQEIDSQRYIRHLHDEPAEPKLVTVLILLRDSTDEAELNELVKQGTVSLSDYSQYRSGLRIADDLDEQALAIFPPAHQHINTKTIAINGNLTQALQKYLGEKKKEKKPKQQKRGGFGFLSKGFGSQNDNRVMSLNEFFREIEGWQNKDKAELGPLQFNILSIIEVERRIKETKFERIKQIVEQTYNRWAKRQS